MIVINSKQSCHLMAWSGRSLSAFPTSLLPNPEDGTCLKVDAFLNDWEITSSIHVRHRYIYTTPILGWTVSICPQNWDFHPKPFSHSNTSASFMVATQDKVFIIFWCWLMFRLFFTTFVWSIRWHFGMLMFCSYRNLLIQYSTIDLEEQIWVAI